MTSAKNDLPSQYRGRAQEARDQAAAATEEDKRKLPMQDAEM